MRDAVICVTDDDKLNLMLALIAKHFGAKKTIVRVARIEYVDLMQKVGVDIVLLPACCQPVKYWLLPAVAASCPFLFSKGPRRKP